MEIEKLNDKQLLQLINDRWVSSETVWDIVKKVYDRNTKYYECEVRGDPKNPINRVPEYIDRMPNKRHRVRANRIFTDMEAVINSLITNPPKPQILPGRDTEESQQLADSQEKFFVIKYEKRNFKEVLRKALRNLYFGRLAVIKPFWNPDINDFDAKALDPRKIRVSKRASNETQSEFIIEEVEDSLLSVLAKFPNKRKEILKTVGVTEQEVGIENPDIVYKEAHFNDYVCCSYNGIILAKFKNPYWDWDGILLNDEENLKVIDDKALPSERKQVLQAARQDQDARRAVLEGKDAPNDQVPDVNFKSYFANHFDFPRKPYIIATAFADQDGPIGRTDLISQAIPLQESIDRRKQQIDDNARMGNGVVKVDSQVMSKAEAQKITWDPEGVIFGSGVKDGVTREFGNALPDVVFKDMQDSREEIDNIMAASSAFRGEREGTETKAGRLALIQRSAARLEEFTQIKDYLDTELLNWCYQLAKLNYTERHYAKTLGEDGARKVIELQQDDFEDGTEIRVIPGQSLPEDQSFKFERAQNDIAAGRISPIDYFRDAGYQNPADTAKNAELYKLNPIKASGVTDEELAEYAPPQQSEQQEPLSVSINYKDIPPEAQIQALARADIEVSPESVMQDKAMEVAEKEQDLRTREQDAELRLKASMQPQREKAMK